MHEMEKRCGEKATVRGMPRMTTTLEPERARIGPSGTHAPTAPWQLYPRALAQKLSPRRGAPLTNNLRKSIVCTRFTAAGNSLRRRIITL